MTDWLPIYIAVGVLGVLYVFLAVTAIQFIQPGQLGLVFRTGHYDRTLQPGFNFVRPFAQIQRVKVGSGANGVLAMAGVAEADLAPDAPPGAIRVGPVVVAATPVARIRAGSAVRVIGDSEKGVVLVAEERPRPGAPPAKPPPRPPPLPSR